MMDMIPGRALYTLKLILLSLLLSAQRNALSAPPSRVISQVPGTTELLYALGLQDRIVGVSTFSKFPPEVREKPGIGGLHDADLEKILILQPDWAVLFKGQDKVSDVLKARGCRVYACQVETIGEMYSSIREIGEIFEIPERAAHLINTISREIAVIRGKLSTLPRKKVLYVVGREPGSLKQLYGVGSGNFMAEMIEAAGGNIAVSPHLGLYPVLSLESILLANPEVILDGGASQLEQESGKMPSEWETLPTLRAVQEKRVVPIDDPRLTIPGPAIPDSIRKLAVLIHGKEAEDRLRD
jgi:iron complex transport system substrate-binding protein